MLGIIPSISRDRSFSEPCNKAHIVRKGMNIIFCLSRERSVNIRSFFTGRSEQACNQRAGRFNIQATTHLRHKRRERGGQAVLQDLMREFGRRAAQAAEFTEEADGGNQPYVADWPHGWARPRLDCNGRKGESSIAMATHADQAKDARVPTPHAPAPRAPSRHARPPRNFFFLAIH